MCIKQALLLNELRSRLTTAGFPAIDFHIINTVNASEEYHKLTDVSRDIPVYQEKEGEKIFEKFGADKDHILVADKCNRLTYQVIMPWSILHYPYVKAAILSTYRDDPCGKCPPIANPNSSEEDEEESGEKISNFNQTSKIDSDESDKSSEIQDILLNFNTSSETNSTVEKFNLTESTTVPIMFFNETTESFEIFENSTGNNATQNVTEESLEIPLSWSTTIDHSLLNSKNNYGNDIEHSLVGLKNEEPALTSFINDSEISNATQTISNKTNEINVTDYNPYVTHRSPAIDEILEIDLNKNDKKNMYWQKHKKYKKNKKDHLKKNELKNSPSTTPIPIRIIFRDSHNHPEEEDDDVSEYIVLKTGDPNYHGHLDGKSYYYKEDNKISKESQETKTIIPGRFDKEGNTEETVTDIYNIPWYDEDEPVYFQVGNEIQKSPEEEIKKVEEESTEKNFVAEERQTSNSTDDKLVSHYSKLLYWVNYSI